MKTIAETMTMEIEVNDGDVIHGITIRFDVRGQLWRGTNNKLRMHGEQYCAGCKRVRPLVDFYKNVNLCIDCHKCSPSTVRNRRKNSNRTMRLYNMRSMWAIDLLGKKCCRCGYNDSYAALEFHHVQPAKKKKGLSEMFGRRSISESEIERELDKCALLCANCHKTYECGDWQGKFMKRKNGMGWQLTSNA